MSLGDHIDATASGVPELAAYIAKRGGFREAGILELATTRTAWQRSVSISTTVRSRSSEVARQRSVISGATTL